MLETTQALRFQTDWLLKTELGVFFLGIPLFISDVEKSTKPLG